MTTFDGKRFINAPYHSAVISLFAVGYARLAKAVAGGPTVKLEFVPRDGAMLVADLALSIETKNLLIKLGLIPADIMKE